MTIEDRLHELGIELTEVFPPAGKYVGAVRTGSLVFVSGAGPIRPDGTFVTGKVGRDVDLDAAKEAARLTGLQLLAVLRAELGSLDRVARVVKTLGMVNCAPGFNRTPAVIDGCSELLDRGLRRRRPRRPLRGGDGRAPLRHRGRDRAGGRGHRLTSADDRRRRPPPLAAPTAASCWPLLARAWCHPGRDGSRRR